MQFHLDHGDTLVLYTDGVTEAMNKSFEEFGEQRLENVLKGELQDCQQIIETVKTQVEVFVDGAEQSDDITLLTLRIQ